MARPKRFHGGNVGVRLPKDVDLCLRAASLSTGKSLSDLIRETLAQTWGKGHKAQEIRTGQ
jgi:predicted HicB family RNase H-like nuclease